jgi:hypothetical protein
MSENKTSYSGGIGVSGLLLVAFIILKLCHVVNWSWLWVLAPAWMPLVLWVLVLAAVFGGAFLVALIAAAFKRE